MAGQVWWKWLKVYLLRESSPSPVFFFAYFAFRHLFTDNDYLWLLHALALFLALTRSYNMLYLLTTCLSVSNSLLSFLFFASSVISCSRKWKLYLFIFVISDSYLSSTDDQSLFIAMASLGFCLAIYRSLIFQTVADNRQYFIGFLVTFAISTVKLIAPSLSIQTKAGPLVLVGVTAGYLSANIFEIRISAIQSLELQKIKDPRIIARYIDLLVQDFKNPAFKCARLQLHQKQCLVASCYCKKKEYSTSEQFYLQQMFQNLRRRLGCLEDEHLWTYYIEFYLQRDQVLTAYYFLLKWRPVNYFSLLSKLKCESIIVDYLQKKNVFNPFVKQYVYGLQYDANRLYLSTEIHEILKLKIDLWKEVGKQSLNMRKLQVLGVQIVEKMYKLNNFYSHTVKEQEKYLYCFDSTVLYGMYLISTTNFKDYARTIIKSTSKQMEQACVSERNASETYVVRAVIKNFKEGNMKPIKTFNSEKNPNSNQIDFRLVIDAVSGGFCRMLNIPKQEIVGNQLHSLIPNCYKAVHNARLSQILAFNSEEIKYVSAAKVLHSQLVLLLKGKDEELYSGLICIKYHMDIEQGVTFLSVVKKTAEKKLMALATFQGQLMQKEKGFPSQVMKHSLVKKYLSQMKQTWNNQRSIKQEQFSLIMDKTNYQIFINSPYAFLLADKEALREMDPPLHIQLLNEDRTLRKPNASYKPNNRADEQIRKMELMMVREQESSTTSSKGVSSVVTVISNFSQNNTVPVYRHIIVAFLVLLIGTVGLNLSFNLLPMLPWDNTVSTYNPITDHLNMLAISMYHAKVALNLQDSFYYQKHRPSLNHTRVSNFYGSTFTSYLTTTFIRLNIDLSLSTFQLFARSSRIIRPTILQRFQTKLIVPNVLNGITLSSQPTQNLTYKQVVFLYTVDIFLNAKRNKQNSILITSIYKPVDDQISNLNALATAITTAFTQAYNRVLAIGLIFIGIMLFLLIPMAIVLRQRFRAHERVFDLLSSIDSSQVVKEIQSLLYIANILSNYNQSQQILKINVLDYPANTINPKHFSSKTRGRKPSVVNELVMGLQKYDVVSNNSADSQSIKNTEKTLASLQKHKLDVYDLAELFNSVRKDQILQLTKQAKFKARIRSGELDLSGSDLDQQRRFTPKHCLIYGLLLSFVPFLGYALTSNLGSLSYAQTVHQTVYQTYNDLYVFNNKLYMAKSYLWGGSSLFASSYNVTNQLTALKAMLLYSMNYDVYNQQETDIIAANSTSKMSQYASSLRVLQSQMASILKGLVEYRYNYQAKSPSAALPPGLYENILFLQLLNNRRETLMKAMVNDIVTGMLNGELQNRQNRRFILILLVLWGVFCFGFGLGVTLKMKDQFFKEVYILTFLNEEMLLTNKRVESYLSSLSKNTYF